MTDPSITLSPDSRLHPLPPAQVPEAFTNPFDYTPHPLVLTAADQVKTAIASHPDWAAEAAKGKMFGVLVVTLSPSHFLNSSPSHPPLFFLAAYSGQLGTLILHPYFVPSIFDVDSSPYYREEMQQIKHIIQLPDERKRRSESLQDWIFDQYKPLNAQGEAQSVTQIFRNYYRRHTLHPERYEQNAVSHHIPSGAGECCETKLLHYAYQHKLQPLCMGTWWIGRSPLNTIRVEGQFYPSCYSRCRPILSYMLVGLQIEASQRQRDDERLLAQVHVLYADDHLLAIDKPAGLLSVPGRNDEPSVIDWLHKHYPAYTLAQPVHRLDQATSGVLLVALDADTLRDLRQQFISRQVHKTYVALVEERDDTPDSGSAHVPPQSGDVTLPLRPDPNDRPRQMVDFEHGKSAQTHWTLLRLQPHPHDTRRQARRIQFEPTTGRTHQLRVHAAHPLGLGTPIVGDSLYGTPADRLYLHATTIRFLHPLTRQPILISAPIPF